MKRINHQNQSLERFKPKTTKFTKNAIIYCRVSDPKQVRDGVSLELQKKTCEELALRNEYNVIRIYEDAGISGKSAYRDSFMQMLDDICENPQMIDCVVFYQITRLGRRLLDILDTIELFRSLGINILSYKDNIQDGAYGNFTISLLGSLAELEASQLRERVVPAMQYQAEKGHWNGGRYKPYGYDNVPIEGQEDKNGRIKKKLKQVEDEAKQVKIIFDLYCGSSTKDEKLGMHLITKHLNENGFKYRDGQDWKTRQVSSILNNALLYAGYIEWGRYRTEFKKEYNQDTKRWENVHSNIGKNKGKPVITRIQNDEWITAKGQHTAIITEETYQKFKEIRDSKPKATTKNKGRNAQYHLTSVLLCQDCGGVMDASMESHGLVYKCRLANASPGRCTANTLKYDYIKEDTEKVFFAYFKLLLFSQIPKMILEKARINVREDNSVANEIIELDEKITTFVDTVGKQLRYYESKGYANEIIDSYYKGKENELNEMKEQLEELKQKQSTTVVNNNVVSDLLAEIDNINNIQEYFYKLDKQKQIDYYRRVFKYIKFKKNKSKVGLKSLEGVYFFINSEEINIPTETEIKLYMRHKELIEHSNLIEDVLDKEVNFFELYQEVIKNVKIINETLNVNVVANEKEYPADEYLLMLDVLATKINTDKTVEEIEEKVNKSLEVAKRYGIELTDEEIAEALKEAKAGI